MRKTLTIEVALDRCLGRMLEAGESLDSVLADYPELAEQLRPELESMMWLRQRVGSLDARSGWLTASRRRLVSQMEQEAQEKTTQRSRTWLQKLNLTPQKLAWQFIFVAAFFLLGVVGSGGAAMANQSLPGDALYPVKMALEEAQLAVSFTAEGDLKLRLEFAARRVNEVQLLALESRYEDVAIAVSEFQKQTEPIADLMGRLEQQDEARYLELSLTLAGQVDALTNDLRIVQGMAPAATRTEIEKAVIFAEEEKAAVLGKKETKWTLTPAVVVSSPTPTLTGTLKPTKTEKPTNTLKPTQDDLLPTITKKASATAKPSLTQRPTDRPTKTPAPTQTEKVDNTRKPPTHTAEPTKEPNPNKPTKQP